MPFIKHDPRINRNGRPAGTKNNNELREILTDAIQNEIENLPETLAQLDPEKRLNLLIKILPFVMPRLENISINDTGAENIRFNPQSISDAELKEINNRLEKLC